MDRPDERYTKQQIAHMLEAAKMRGFPVEHMTWRNFINYLKQKAPDIIRYALFNPRPSLAICHADTTQASLSFDGEHLYWQQPGSGESWRAYSGARELWAVKDFSIEAQKMRDKGPIPEGTYTVSQAEYQRRPEELWEGMLNSIGRGKWKWGYAAWGNHRVWLEPQSGTEVYARTNFSIHGGAHPGSAGCIDLVEAMPAFVARFLDYGKNMILVVDYGAQRYKSAHTPHQGPKTPYSHHNDHYDYHDHKR